MGPKASSNAQLRRAAGSSSVETLRQALEEGDWTAQEIDGMASEDGKNALHMAAWTGCIDNVRLLLDMGCCINEIATGEYSYGKTPIFFAATRCRDDVVCFLLERGALVNVVNNKGQSVLSIASSHLQTSTIARIQQAERNQSHIQWRNYRLTHSDGLEYGDLDPRFLERPLVESDVVTPFAVNYTTKQSRRGSFLRRNPHLAPEPTASTPPLSTGRSKRKAKKTQETLSAEEEADLALALKALEGGSSSAAELLTVVNLSEKRRQPWINALATQLRSVFSEREDRLNELFHAARVESLDAPRLAALLERLCAQTCGEGATFANGDDGTRNTNAVPPEGRPGRRKLVFSNAWSEASSLVAHLSLSSFIQDSEECLQLPESPVWVDTVEQLDTVMRLAASERLVAFDTEWVSSETTQKAASQVATIQLSWDNHVWVVDLLRDDDRYQAGCRQVIEWLFLTKLMLGFALGRDIPKLEAWLGRTLDTSRILDLQAHWSATTSAMVRKSPRSNTNVPGLAACARELAPHHLLSKAEQCSDWNRRPLSESQLAYAGLDAAILPALLAERTRSWQQQ